MFSLVKKMGAVLGLAMVAAAPALAGNIVLDGGFELNDGSWSTGTWTNTTNTRGIHTGERAMMTGCLLIDFGCRFRQSLATVAGQRYDISFWLYADGSVDANGTPVGQFDNGLQVWFGADVVKTIRNFASTNLGQDPRTGGPSTLITIHDVLATSNSTLLQFGGYHEPAAIWVDDVSVVAVEPPAEVGEPGTLALAGLALAGMASLRRRKSN